MKRNLIFWGTVITSGTLLVLINIYVYQPEKRTITFFKIENQKVVPPQTIIHKHNLEKPQPKSNEGTKEKEITNEKQKNNEKLNYNHNEPRKLEIKQDIRIPNKVENEKKLEKHTNTKHTKIEKPIRSEKQTDVVKTDLKDIILPQPLYHVKKTDNEKKPDNKKPEIIYHKEKLFEYQHTIKDYFEQNTPHSEYLWVANNEDYIHTTAHSSKIKLHNPVFVNKYNKKVEGDVVVEFKEIVNKSDLFKSNVNTSIDKKPKRIHKVWYINAQQKHKPIFLGANTVITIQTQSTEELGFCTGKRNYMGEIEWQPINKNQIEKVEVITGKGRKSSKQYEYYCNIADLGWIAAFYEKDEESKPVLVNVKAPSELSANEISVYYLDENINYSLYNANQIAPVTNKRFKLVRKIKQYTQGNIFEGSIIHANTGKIIAIGYDKGKYYFAQTFTNAHKGQIELNLLPIKESEINHYICND